MTNKKLLGLFLLGSSALLQLQAQTPFAQNDKAELKNFGFFNNSTQEYESQVPVQLIVNVSANDTAFTAGSYEIITNANNGTTELDTSNNEAVLKYTSIVTNSTVLKDSVQYRFTNGSGDFDSAWVSIDYKNIHAVSIDFDDLNLGTDGYINGSDLSGGFFSGSAASIGSVSYSGAYFNNSYNPAWGSWSGISASNHTDTTTAGYTNQYSTYAGEANSGSNFMVAYSNGARIDVPAFQGLKSLMVSNATYSYLSMKNGDGFAKKFGGESGNDPDYFKLNIVGFATDNSVIDTQEVYLADFRFTDNSQDFILNGWNKIEFDGDLSTEKIAYLKLYFESTDTNSFGVKTPTYVCFDDIMTNDNVWPISSEELNTPVASIYPNPTNGQFTIDTKNDELKMVDVYGIDGKHLFQIQTETPSFSADLTGYPNGVYFVRVLGKTIKVVKQ
jgi:hypothetical protein